MNSVDREGLFPIGESPLVFHHLKSVDMYTDDYIVKPYSPSERYIMSKVEEGDILCLLVRVDSNEGNILSVVEAPYRSICGILRSGRARMIPSPMNFYLNWLFYNKKKSVANEIYWEACKFDDCGDVRGNIYWSPYQKCVIKGGEKGETEVPCIRFKKVEEVAG